MPEAVNYPQEFKEEYGITLFLEVNHGRYDSQNLLFLH